MLGLCCCLGFSLVVVSMGYSLVVVNWFPIDVASLVADTGSRVFVLPELQHMISGVVAPGLQGTGSVVRAHSLVATWNVGSSWIRDQTHVSCIGRWIPYH